MPNALRALLLLILLTACQRDPEPTPPPPVAQTWWQGDWRLDLERMDLDAAPPPAGDVVRALGPTATYALTGTDITRSIADATDRQPWTLHSATADHASFDVEGGALRLERRADGVWLVEGPVELPLTR